MTFRTPVALLVTTALAFGAAACGSDETGSAGGGSAGGDAATKPVAEVENLTGKMTEVTLDEGFVEALTSLKVTPGPVGDATIEDGVASFPITAGNVQYFTPGTVSPFVRGIINHDGAGLSLEAGGKEVELENLDVDPGKSVLTGDVSVDGTEAAPDAPLFFLDGRTLNPLQANDDGTAVLEGTTVKLKQEAADLLNMTFDIEALKAGMVIGVAKITLNTR
ncbi:MAG: hypothetical protein M3417_15585 [Actinomycetota bacterium]|nr:hypothetical protein [Actinomycetota bacterium]